MISLSLASRLDLNNITQGWEEVQINGCAQLLQRGSFGFTCTANNFYVFGGFSHSILLNSALNITIGNVLQCEIMIEEITSPRRRQAASMVYTAGGFFLFAGEDQGVLLNDLWYYNLTTLNWTLIKSTGDIPSPRRRHAADCQGNYMAIVGGIGENSQLLQDYYLLDTRIFEWVRLNPLSNNLPPPIAFTCLMMRFPKLYYVGGLEESQLTLTLWELDISTLIFTKIYQYNPSTDIPLIKHNCLLVENEEGLNNFSIFTFFGSQNILDEPFCGVQEFDFTKKPVVPVIVRNETDEMPCRTDAAFANIDYKYFAFAGGQRFGKMVFDDVWIINVTVDWTEIRVGTDLAFPIYNSASAFINNTLYIYSGFSYNGISINSPSNDLFQNIEFTNSSYADDLSCGMGMVKNGTECAFCGLGTFNDDVLNRYCNSCPMGTYNLFTGGTDITQCVPCQEGTFSLDPSKPCEKCKTNEICYIGTSDNSITIAEQETIKKYLKSDIQPPVYEPPDIVQDKIILYIVTAAVIVLYLFIYYMSYNFRVVLGYYDLFKNIHFEIHSNQDGEHIAREMIYRPSKFGGFCTVLTLITIVAVTCQALIIYIKTNTIEEIILVPIDSMTQQHEFNNEEFKIDVTFSSYRGDCSFEFFDISQSSNINLADTNFTQTGVLCEFTGKFTSNELINTGDSIKFSFDQSSSFTSDIIVRLSTDSSVPNYISRVVQNITSDQGKVFRGSIPTTFTFAVLPSYYQEKDLVSEIYSSKGYHISTATTPIAGSQFSIEGIPLSNGLVVEILLVRSDIGITTYKYPEIDFLTFFFKTLSDIPGTVVFIGFLMWFAEYIKHLFDGKTSGRYRLAKRQMEEERLEREGQKKARLLKRNRDPSFGMGVN